MRRLVQLLAKFSTFFSKLVLVIARLPTRSLRICLLPGMLLLGLVLGSCSRDILALPSKYWYKRCNFCLAVTGAESITLSKAFSHRRICFVFLRHCLQKHQASHAVVAATG